MLTTMNHNQLYPTRSTKKNHSQHYQTMSTTKNQSRKKNQLLGNLTRACLYQSCHVILMNIIVWEGRKRSIRFSCVGTCMQAQSFRGGNRRIILMSVSAIHNWTLSSNTPNEKHSQGVSKLRSQLLRWHTVNSKMRFLLLSSATHHRDGMLANISIT